MPDKPRCVVEKLRGIPDPRQRILGSNDLLEQLAAATKAVRDVRDAAIVEMSDAGTKMHEILHVSKMSRSHVTATVRRRGGDA